VSVTQFIGARLPYNVLNVLLDLVGFSSFFEVQCKPDQKIAKHINLGPCKPL
jgi:hypothetical protein